MDGALDLYPAQKRGVTRFLAASRPRMILAYGTGCGKTPTAIRAMVARLDAQDGMPHTAWRILVVCPAIVRRHWIHEFRRWADMEAHPIEMGRRRQSGTKKALAARDEAYRALVQVTSYDLAAEVDEAGWDGIIFDEVHHLSDATSKQSRVARWLMKQNVGVPCLGLSATLIPTELWQLWHPMFLLFGPEWGKAPRAGKISWDFVSRYCDIERNEYGAAPGALKPGAEAKLRGELEKTTHRLTREDIADDLPAIDISVLDVPGNTLARPTLAVVGKAPRVRPEIEHAVEWVKALENDVHHAVILCYHRDVAQSIMQAVCGAVSSFGRVVVVDGSAPTAERVEELAEAEAAPRAIVIATTESIREGIRLMWAQKVLLAEWRQSPKQVIQVLGRFNSVGDRRRPQIQVLSDESLYGASRRLLSRMSGINKLIRGGATEDAVEKTFALSELNADSILRQTKAMLELGPRAADADWLEDTGDDDEW